MSEEKQTVALLLHIADMLSRRTDQVLQERLGMSLAQYKVLQQIAARPGITQRQVADLLFQTEAAVSRQVGLLCSKDLLILKVNKANRRERNLYTAAKAGKLLDAAREASQAIEHKMLRAIPDKMLKHTAEVHQSIHQELCKAPACLHIPKQV